MRQNDPDEKLVYLACQHIFRGPLSHVRKLKVIKALIKENEHSLASFLREHSINRTIQIAKRLLEDQIFDDTLKAKIRFPELFDVSPTQSSKREVSEAAAVRDEASALEEVPKMKVSRDIDVVSQGRSDNGGDKEPNSKYTT